MTIAVFIGRRIIGAVAVLLVVSSVIFGLLQLSPGSTVVALLGGRPSTPELVSQLEAKYHLDESAPAQYLHWLSRASHGDLGQSAKSGEPVTNLIERRLAVTFEVVALAVLAVLIVGIPAGFFAGVHSGGRLDRLVSVTSIVALSAPVFVVGIVLIYLFGITLHWLPVYGAGSGVTDRFLHLCLPATALALSLGALVVRQTRAAVLDVMQQDYITFARARGLSPARVNLHYALRNSALPIVTVSGLLVVYAVAGTVLVETVFSVPGLGSLLTDAIQNKDIATAQGVALVVALSVVVVNLLVDVAAIVLDPRLRHAGGV